MIHLNNELVRYSNGLPNHVTIHVASIIWIIDFFLSGIWMFPLFLRAVIQILIVPKLGVTALSDDF